MTYQLLITQEAYKDMDNGFFWYEKKRFGLGLEFLATIKATLSSIQRTPFLHQKVAETVHRAYIPRFNYGIYFEIVATQINVLAVLNSRMNPEIWQERVN